MAAATTSKRMTQTEIINQLADKSGMKKTDAKEFSPLWRLSQPAKSKRTANLLYRVSENW